MSDKTVKSLSSYIFLTMAISSFVVIEPSPYDLLMSLLLISCIVLSYFSISRKTAPPIIIGLLFLLTNLISLFFVKQASLSVMYFFITVYLVGTFIFLIALGQRMKFELFRIILGGYMLSALLSTLLGIGAYFNLFEGSDSFLMFGRVKSMFKDPNVFGPFLVIPALYALAIAEGSGKLAWKRYLYFSAFLILTIGIIISFSRAAWGNFALAFILYMAAVKKGTGRNRLRTIRLILVIAIPSFLYFIQTPAVEELLSTRLSIKNYDSDRFGTQQKAFVSGLSNLLGMGPGQSELLFQYSPHSLYARVFTENGLGGLLVITTLFISAIVRAFQNFMVSAHTESALHAIIVASLIGLAFNSFFIDTLHWRHLWIVLALAWFPVRSRKMELGK
ncbi:O-antigen ligase family protein [Sporosarcina sp. FSL K6-1508]|uniref:O-antigen ligase family protein n=1 Tax=Sporosarcina sp. FSL K6-1508 TaxID=2921553 RepID=UPI0030F9EA89